MIVFIARRLLAAIPLLLLVSLISYGLMGLAPGGPTAIFQAQARQLSPAARAEFIHALGLDKPWYVQYAYWLGNLVFHGNLGNSFVDHRPVVTKIVEKMPVTLEMLSLALLCTIAIAIPIGIYSAVRRGSAFDYAATVLAFASYGMPVFWLSVILIDAFAVNLRLFPTSGIAFGRPRTRSARPVVSPRAAGRGADDRESGKLDPLSARRDAQRPRRAVPAHGPQQRFE